MKRFVLTDVIPAIIRKRVWESVPKVWEGVPHAIKSLADHKYAEPTLRCILGLPKAQLKVILKTAPKAKLALGKLLQSLSPVEKEEVISGRWAGIVDSIVDNNGMDTITEVTTNNGALNNNDNQSIVHVDGAGGNISNSNSGVEAVVVGVGEESSPKKRSTTLNTTVDGEKNKILKELLAAAATSTATS